MSLDWTGERLLPEIDAIYGTFEHLHRYAIALELCKDKDVLDIACGEGYGSNLLAKVSRTTIGVDVSSKVVNHAKLKYVKENLSFLLGSATNIPLNDNSADVVVSFETLEHFVDHDAFVSEVKRVLRPNGVLIISTPDRSLYHLRDANNKFHLKELDTDEFVNLISSAFRFNRLFKQRIVIGSLINDNLNNEGCFKLYDGGFAQIDNGFNNHEFFNTPFFNIIFASNCKIDLPSISLFSAYNAYEAERRDLLSRLIYYKSINDRLKRHWIYKIYSLFIHKIFILSRSKK